MVTYKISFSNFQLHISLTNNYIYLFIVKNKINKLYIYHVKDNYLTIFY